MKFVLKIASVILMTNIATAAASASTNPTTANPQALRVRLSAPARAPLGANEIRSVISGKALLLDELTPLAPGVILDVLIEGGCPPVESFYSDGRWERGTCARGYIVRHGHWGIKAGIVGSELCTTIEGQEAYCRTVWQRLSSDRLILTVSGRRFGNPEYNPYKTKPL
ncbi:hypothetical protein U1872_07060 [Sphingomonas sp. RB3P16]|uniref:hypothetical protein n=1 Tax=Parasphingomonas frigoris TaxID=3096163 RepID=UPI002FC91938